MTSIPTRAAVTALLDDHACAPILNALMSGEALTAVELAAQTHVPEHTLRAQIDKLLGAGLVRSRTQGRHRYVQLANPQVGMLLCSIDDFAQHTAASPMLRGPRDPALRRARRCYGHLAGEVAVEAFDSFVERGFMVLNQPQNARDTLVLTRQGRDFFTSLGIELTGSGGSNRALCRPCLDWSMRRSHLAGSLGRALLEFTYARGWAESVKDSRVVRFSANGLYQFRGVVSNNDSNLPED